MFGFWSTTHIRKYFFKFIFKLHFSYSSSYFLTLNSMSSCVCVLITAHPQIRVYNNINKNNDNDNNNNNRVLYITDKFEKKNAFNQVNYVLLIEKLMQN